MAEDSKDTIYIDVDEEITGIISKIQNSPKDIIALVLPKRASVLQSIVNMKLLKRAQEQHNKKVVLITSEGRILPLAGAAGLFVASNLTSKPYVPPVPKPGDKPPVSDEEETEIDPNTPLSQVAPDAKFAESGDEIEIDNTPKTPKASEASSAGKKAKKSKKAKVPNFSSFRKKAVIIGAALLIFIGLLVWAFLFAPKANVTIKAETNELPLSFGFAADPNANSFDSTNQVARAEAKNDQKDFTEKINATGQKNKGKKASGTVNMTAKKCGGNPFDTPSSVSSGRDVNSNGVTYITQQSTSFTTTGATTDSQGCYIYPSTGSTQITAQSGGANANVNNATFSVSGRSDVSAQGTTSGGTDNIVKVVDQADVDKAKERLKSEPNSVHDNFISQLKADGYVPIDDSFKATPGNYDISPAVGAEGDQVTVSVTISYKMLGVKQDDLQQLVKNQLNQQDQGKGQNILSYGFDAATIKANSAGSLVSAGQSSWTIDTKVVVGPDLNQDNIKSQIAGKKSGEAQDIIGQIPGVNSAQVQLSPFWVGSVPKSSSKIDIQIQQSNGNSIAP